MPDKTPRELADQIIADSRNIADEKTKRNMLEAAETIDYLLKLLDYCVKYIHDNNEYNADPRFLRAARDALEKS